jgi:hypothetical protein
MTAKRASHFPVMVCLTNRPFAINRTLVSVVERLFHVRLQYTDYSVVGADPGPVLVRRISFEIEFDVHFEMRAI